MMVQYCVVPRCKNNALIPGISFHVFPQDPVLRRLWEIKIRRDERICYGISPFMRVCSEHFKESDFTTGSRRRCLRKDAVPSVFTYNSQKQETIQQQEQSLKSDVLGAEHSEKDNKTFKLQLKDKTSNNSTEFSDKSLRIVEKSTSVVHSSFHSSQADSTENIPEAKMLVMKYTYSKINPVSTSDKSFYDKENTDSNLVIEQNLFTVKEFLTYEKLLKNWSLIKKPNNFWGVTVTTNFIICARWNEDYIAEKRVVITSSLIVRVFLKEWEINISDLMDITCIDDISNLLEKLESYKIS